MTSHEHRRSKARTRIRQSSWWRPSEDRTDRIASLCANLGDDNGCFVSALTGVLSYGGVLEHPEASHAFAAYGIVRPVRGQWKSQSFAGIMSIFVTCVAQGNYGHKARKLTWLIVRSDTHPIDLDWSIPRRDRLDEGFHSTEQRRAARAAGIKPLKKLSVEENRLTPLPFRDLLISIATNANVR